MNRRWWLGFWHGANWPATGRSAGGLFGHLFGRFARRPADGLASGLTTLVALTLVGVALGCAAIREASAPQTFRVMTFNIHHGEGTDGRVDLERVAGVIERERADVVALQEVDRGVRRTQGRDLPKELAALTGMTCVFSNNFHFQGGEYGNAVLTRFPVERWTNTHLRMLRPGEQRGVLQVVLNVRGRSLLLLATHLDYRADDAERLQSVAQLAEIVRADRGLPMLAAGDFNDVPGSRTYRALTNLFEDVWPQVGEGPGFTYPSAAPGKRIDYLWISKGAPFRATRAWVPATDASDHRPLVAEFEW